MANSLSLSIIIPAFNEAEQLAGCLDSIAAQTELPDEVIVVNNNSSDTTEQIARSYPFVTLLQESEQGIVYARDTGFNAAQSDIIARIDADTNLPSDWVARAKFLAADLRVGDAITGPCYFRNTPIPSVMFALHRIVYFWSSRALLGHSTLFGSNMLLLRKSWEQVRYDTCCENSIHEDMDLAAHLFENGGQIYFERDLLATISSRRWGNGWQYPKMWLKTKLVHLER
jgi:glycosyltransferase involved in cell wall biosynthesis